MRIELCCRQYDGGEGRTGFLKMVSQHLVEQWRIRLADWQRRLVEGRPRPWMARAYVRVLSFLLAQYGAQPESGESLEAIEPMLNEAKADDRRSSAKPAIPDAEFSGKPPKSRTQIRSALEAVQASVPHAEQGPRIDGPRPNDPIIVASLYGAQITADLKTMLENAEIKCQLKRFGPQTQVVVSACDLDRAKPIVASHAATNRDSSLFRREHARTWSRMGSSIGFCIGIVVAIVLIVALLAATNEPFTEAFWVVAFIICYACLALPTGFGWVIGLLLGTIIDG